MNKIFVIGFIGGFSSIIYCLMHKNKNINNIEIKYNHKKNINSDKLIIYQRPRPIYELYLKNEWEIL